MTTDDFTKAARAEAERRWPRLERRNKTAKEWLDEGMASGFVLGAQWSAAQKPTDGEVEEAADAILGAVFGQELPEAPIDLARAALSAARAARRDEATR